MSADAAVTVTSLTAAREAGLQAATGSLSESRKSATVLIRVIYLIIVAFMLSFDMFTYVAEHRVEVAGQQNVAAAKQSRKDTGVAAVQQTCPPISAITVGRCTLSEKPIVLITEQLAYAEVLEFCLVRPAGEATFISRKVGPNAFEVRSTQGILPVEYKLLRGTCPNSF